MTRRVASIPSSSGIWMSITTTSGPVSAMTCRASPAVGRGADHLHAFEGTEERDQTVAHDLVVVDDDDPDRGSRQASPAVWTVVSGSQARTTVPPAGGQVTSLRPPSSSARSRSDSSPMPA